MPAGQEMQKNSPFLKFDRRKDHGMQHNRALHEMQPPIDNSQ